MQPMTAVRLTSVAGALLVTLAACEPVPEAGTPVGSLATSRVPSAPPTGLSQTAAGTPATAPGTLAPLGATTVPGAAPTVAVATSPAPTDAPDGFLGLSAAGGAVGSIYSLTDLRTGEHDGFTRIVWELSQTGSTPSFTAVERSNTTEPPAGGSVAGAARIEVLLVDTSAMGIAGKLPLATPDSPVVQGVSIGLTEDDSRLLFAVALAEPARFEIVSLEDPAAATRLVLDIFHP